MKLVSSSAFSSSLAFLSKVEINFISAWFFSELLSFDEEISSKSSGNLFISSVNKYSLFSTKDGVWTVALPSSIK